MAAGEPIRRTPQRTAILEQLRSARAHPTADQLYETVRDILPRVSLATVYRNLQLLANRGVIRKLCPGEGPMRFDAEPSPHRHIYCVRCGRVEDVDGGPPQVAQPEVEKSTGYRILGCELIIHGCCPDCCTGTDTISVGPVGESD